MNKKKLVMVFVFAFAIIGFVLMSKGVSAKMPDSQCYKAASNIDNAVQNTNPEFQSEHPFRNPCTGEITNRRSYWHDGAPYLARWVFENGDVMGYKMNTRYWLCTDGRAKVENWALFYIMGRAWGVWAYHPLVDWTNNYRMEQCNTM
jgi:hypothetical protein